MAMLCCASEVLTGGGEVIHLQNLPFPFDRESSGTTLQGNTLPYNVTRNIPKYTSLQSVAWEAHAGIGVGSEVF